MLLYLPSGNSKEWSDDIYDIAKLLKTLKFVYRIVHFLVGSQPRYRAPWEPPELRKAVRIHIAYLSDKLRPEMFRHDQFNLIASGTGTGKSYWAIHTMLEQFPDIKPQEVIFATSRALTRDQITRHSGAIRYDPSFDSIKRMWNGQDVDPAVIADYGITVMTYDRLIDLILNSGDGDHEVLQNVRAVIFDECHALFSDTFIDNISSVWLWARDLVYAGKKICIGLTATPNIVVYNRERWSVPLNILNADDAIKYKAKQMVCTTFDSIPYLICSNHLPGRSIVLCASITDARKLQAQIPNSAIMVSPHAKEFTPEVAWLRDYIAKHESLPDNFPVFVSENKKTKERTVRWEHLNVLLTTSTMREGLNIREKSGVRNMITCFTDEMNVTQFLGRCRYEVDNLVLAKTFVRSDNVRQSQYIIESRKLFDQYMENKKCVSFFNAVSHLVQHDVYGIKRFVLGSDDVSFVAYINSRWLVPIGSTGRDLDRYKIWRDEDKSEIVAQAIRAKLFPLFPSQVTFAAVIKLLRRSLGYEIQSKQGIVDHARKTYKLIISFDEEKVSYKPAYETEVENW